MVDHSNMRLGRKAIKTDTRTLALGDYLTPALPPPPPTVDWTKGITDWGMMLNDKLGDCTIAGVAHALQVWSTNTGAEVTVPDATVEKYYELWDGYVPGNPATDSGGVELDVLNDWQKQNFDGHDLLAFADPKYTNLVEVHQSIALFGGVYIGLALPVTAQKQDVWDVVPNGGANARKGSWGGHCVYVPKYDQHGFTCITWGGLKTMTLAFWKKYCDEAHTLLGQNWLTDKGAPSGFDQTQLLADLKAIR
ncbi:MAG: hypothetical protein P4K86_12330 [Terracidiphilus sp.]|nr:hypothetical protein [Terracidiphilus sp.]MDR3777300.1 hypothetical protein [Terracidiphilus sp.]